MPGPRASLAAPLASAHPLVSQPSTPRTGGARPGNAGRHTLAPRAVAPPRLSLVDALNGTVPPPSPRSARASVLAPPTPKDTRPERRGDALRPTSSRRGSKEERERRDSPPELSVGFGLPPKKASATPPGTPAATKLPSLTSTATASLSSSAGTPSVTAGGASPLGPVLPIGSPIVTSRRTSNTESPAAAATPSDVSAATPRDGGAVGKSFGSAGVIEVRIPADSRGFEVGGRNGNVVVKVPGGSSSKTLIETDEAIDCRITIQKGWKFVACDGVRGVGTELSRMLHARMLQGAECLAAFEVDPETAHHFGKKVLRRTAARLELREKLGNLTLQELDAWSTEQRASYLQDAQVQRLLLDAAAILELEVLLGRKAGGLMQRSCALVNAAKAGNLRLLREVVGDPQTPPEIFMFRDGGGNLPLHHAVNLHAARLLLEKEPKAKGVRNWLRQTPACTFLQRNPKEIGCLDLAADVAELFDLDAATGLSPAMRSQGEARALLLRKVPSWEDVEGVLERPAEGMLQELQRLVPSGGSWQSILAFHCFAEPSVWYEGRHTERSRRRLCTIWQAMQRAFVALEARASGSPELLLRELLQATRGPRCPPLDPREPYRQELLTAIFESQLRSSKALGALYDGLDGLEGAQWLKQEQADSVTVDVDQAAVLAAVNVEGGALAGCGVRSSVPPPSWLVSGSFDVPRMYKDLCEVCAISHPLHQDSVPELFGAVHGPQDDVGDEDAMMSRAYAAWLCGLGQQQHQRALRAMRDVLGGASDRGFSAPTESMSSMQMFERLAGVFAELRGLLAASPPQGTSPVGSALTPARQLLRQAASFVTDIHSCTLLAETPEELRAAVGKVAASKEVTILRCVNGFHEEKRPASGYREMTLWLRLRSGAVLQQRLLLRRFFDVRSFSAVLDEVAAGGLDWPEMGKRIGEALAKMAEVHREHQQRLKEALAGESDSGNLKAEGFSLTELLCAGFQAKQLLDMGYSVVQLRQSGVQLEDLMAAGVTVADAKEAGATAHQLRELGLPLAQLIEGGFTATELKEAGFAAKQLKGSFRCIRLKEAGYTLEELKEAGCMPVALKEAGFSLEELQQVGFTMMELKAAGFDRASLKEVGFAVEDMVAGGWTPKDLKDAGFGVDQLVEAKIGAEQLREAGFDAKCLRQKKFTASELKAAGFAAEPLREAGFAAVSLREADFSATELVEGGYSVEQLMSAGLTPKEMREAGVPVEKMKEAGFALLELHMAGYDARELKEAGFTARQLKDVGVPLPALLEAQYGVGQLQRVGYRLSELRAAGVTAKELRSDLNNLELLKEAGFTPAELADGGFTAAHLKRAGFDIKELVEVGFTAVQLRMAGYTATELVSVGFTLTSLVEAGYTCDQLILAGFTLGMLKEQGLQEGRLIFHLKEAGWKLADIKMHGFSGKEIKQQGYRAKDFLDAGFTLQEVRASGFLGKELKEAGFSLATLVELRLSIQELRDADFTLLELYKVGYSGRQLREAGFTVHEMVEAEIKVSYLEDAGFSAAELLEAGFTVAQLKAFGFTADKLTSAGLPAATLKEFGFTAVQLFAAGVRLAELRQAGFGVAELAAVPGCTGDHLRRVGFSDTEIGTVGLDK